MQPLVFIDLWPEVDQTGQWKERFAAVPVALTRAGFTAVVQHHTRIDVRQMTGAPPAGIILSDTTQYGVLEERVKPVVSLFTPIFFVVVGSSVDLRLLDPSRPGSGGVPAAPVRRSGRRRCRG